VEKEIMPTNFLEICRQQFMGANVESVHPQLTKAGTLYPVNQMHPLVLAYIGDAVYELYVRLFALQYETKVRNLHKTVTGLVRASTQAGILKSIESELTEEEQIAAKRGRNAKVGHTPKNAEMIEYRLATGFETLLGYLFLTGQDERLMELLNIAVNEGQRKNKNSGVGSQESE
jgi:ribonuclease-3 family protein